MFKLTIFILISISSAWAFYPPADENSRALFQALKGKETEVKNFLQSQIDSANTYSSQNYEVRMTTVPAAEGVPPAEWVPVINHETRKLVVELRITEEGLKSPLVMAEEILNLNQITSGGFTHPYEWAETVSNAKAGSIRSTEKLARLDYQAARQVKSWLDSNLNFFEGEVDQAKLEEWGKVRIEEAKARYEPIAKASKAETKRLTDEWAKQRPVFTQLEREEKKFNDYVMANDRAGARRMLEKYLPWTLMEPSESRAWKTWLDAMEHPNQANRLLVFRGMDGYPILKTAGSDKVGVFSSLLAMNQGNYTRRLRSLTTSRDRFGQPMYSYVSPEADGTVFPKDEPSLIDQMKNHAGNPQGSPFISVSDNRIATRFGSQERMALLVDERRLVPNALAFGYGEIERLIPLVIFPDEVVYYQGKVSKTDYTPINDEQFLAKVTERLGRPIEPGELNANVSEDEFLKRGFDRLSALMLEPAGPDAIQGAACVLGSPCDCVRKGFERLLNEH